MDRAPLGTIEIDSTGLILHSNLETRRILRLSERDKMPGHLDELVRLQERPLVQQAVRSAFSSTPTGTVLHCNIFVGGEQTSPAMISFERCPLVEGAIRCAAFVTDLSVAGIIGDVLRDLDAELLEKLEAFNAPDLHFIRKDETGHFKLVNKTFRESLGKPYEEIIGTTDHEHYDRVLWEKYIEDDRWVMRTRCTLEVIERNVGDKIVQVVKTPVFNSLGNVVGVQAVFWDVKHRDRVATNLVKLNGELAAQLKNIHAQYHRQFNNPAVGFFRSTPAGRFDRVNGALVGIFGYNSEKELREVEHVRSLYARPHQRQEFVEEIERTDRFEMTYEVLRRDGSKRQVLECAWAVRHPITRAVEFYEGTILDTNTIRDLRQDLERAARLKAMELSLALQFQRTLRLDDPDILSLQVRHVLCALTAADGLSAHRAMAFQSANGSVEGICGVGPKDGREAEVYRGTIAAGNISFDQCVAEMRRPDFKHPDRLHYGVIGVRWRRTDLGPDLVRCLQDGRASRLNPAEKAVGRPAEFFRKHDVQDAWVVPLMEGGSALGFITLDCIYPDHQGRLPAHAAEIQSFAHLLPGLLARAAYMRDRQRSLEVLAVHGIKSRLQRLGHIRDELVAATSGDLGGGGRLALEDLKSVTAEFQKAIDRMRRIAASQPSSPCPVEVNPLVTSLLQKHDGDGRFDFSSDLRQVPPAECDSSVLEDILEELLDNAYAARLDGNMRAKVRFSTSVVSKHSYQILDKEQAVRDGDYVCLQVADSGRGIPQAVRPYLFQPWYPGTPAGFGLGLAAARIVLRAYGGFITETGLPRGGACLELFLRAANQNAADNDL